MTVSSPPYEALAPLYDLVMEDVQYDLWAEFLDDIIQEHHPDAIKIHEIACGTGSMTLELDAFGCYEISGSDRSPHMLKIAKEKAAAAGSRTTFFEMDFTMDGRQEPAHPSLSGFDVVFCVFDSMNYILDPAELGRVISRMGKLLSKEGIFVFDVTTTLHSSRSIEWLDQEQVWVNEHLFIHRESRFDAGLKRHTNTFRMFERPRSSWIPDLEDIPDKMETHVQRPYEISELVDLVEAAGVTSWSAYGEFDLDPADATSERITVVCRW